MLTCLRNDRFAGAAVKGVLSKVLTGGRTDNTDVCVKCCEKCGFAEKPTGLDSLFGIVYSRGGMKKRSCFFRSESTELRRRMVEGSECFVKNAAGN